MGKHNAVIFDLDGTLLDTIKDLADSVNFALSMCGYKERTLKEVTSFVGDGVRMLIKRSVPEGTDEEGYEKVFLLFKEHYHHNSNNKTKPFEGIEDLIIKLKSLGYKIGVVSNKYDSAVKELVLIHFENMISVAIGESEEIRRKPNPDGVIKALKTLSVRKEEAVYIGDSEVDLKTAQNAGVDCILVSWGYRDKEFLQNCKGALGIADKPLDILNFL